MNEQLSILSALLHSSANSMHIVTSNSVVQALEEWSDDKFSGQNKLRHTLAEILTET